jgi:hypothetical protein
MDGQGTTAALTVFYGGEQKTIAMLKVVIIHQQLKPTY